MACLDAFTLKWRFDDMFSIVNFRYHSLMFVPHLIDEWQLRMLITGFCKPWACDVHSATAHCPESSSISAVSVSLFD